ncbi:Major facilitator superfamily domain, general substrate transporter [Penicillium expansum]|uniref:Major facilitator superfamily domain, general substrate transporter n=1 Tax=Penicillium expansum TaxID=27334 RepID=A0A0A2JVE1_PENEN|nr:Major facilitator superfamily domain, general substrate transporter [Penicillium expansum]KGO43192.1 Major facilitator superfamily domain, general substrate transporter [Penicillium expansum]KGO52372.1 Major facilitator superfamily domain, general substrate transporter [Penicillium expansum]KGO59432.1 Major facilitator superfamily domain, general substrate transporter [Penicillium expansum]
MANPQSTSTGISLQDLNTNLGERPARATQNDLSSTPTELDIMQQSLLADSQVPDGGEAWVVISGCAVVTWWFIGTSYCWGILQAALVKEGVSSSSTLAFVGSLATACISFLGILNARIIRKLGTRISAMVGVFFLGLGEVLSGFSAMNIGGLFATAGIVMGIGISLCFMVVSVTPAQYFRAKRGIANGIVYAAGGLGGAVISFVMNALLERVGVQWTFRIIGFATWATGLPAAYLIKQRVPIPPSAFVDWRLFRDIRFVLLFAMGAIATFPLLVPPFFLPLFTASLGMSSGTGAGIVAAFNFSSALGRLLCGLCSDFVGPLNTLFISLLLSALSMLIIWPISTSLGPLVVFVIVNGMANGGFFSTMPTVVGNTFGSARVSVVMGMVVTGWAGGYLLGAPIAGFILDAAGGESKGITGYRPAIVYAGSMALVASIIGLSIRLKTDKKLLKKL